MPNPKSKSELERGVMSILLDQDPIATDIPQTLHINNLVPFANHPFKLYEGERLDDMVRSIKEHGIITPIVARPLDENEGTYEILSGHNRVNAAKIAGLTKVPVHIKKELSDEEAALIVTETNLVQRSFADLSHSERAIALKYHLDAVKEESKLLQEIKKLSNPDEIKENDGGVLLEHRMKSREITAAKYGLSPANVTRYVRLNSLNQPLLDRVDSDEIGLYPAVSLSYLSLDEQAELNRILDETTYKVDMKKAESLREFSESKKLTDEKMIQILSGELNKKPKPKTAPPLKIKAKIYQKYFDGNTTQTEMETVIDQALAEYFENHKEMEVTA